MSQKVSTYDSPEYQVFIQRWYYPLSGINESKFKRAIYSQEWLLRDRSNYLETVTWHPDLTEEDLFNTLKAQKKFEKRSAYFGFVLPVAVYGIIWKMKVERYFWYFQRTWKTTGLIILSLDIIGNELFRKYVALAGLKRDLSATDIIRKYAQLEESQDTIRAVINEQMPTDFSKKNATPQKDSSSTDG